MKNTHFLLSTLFLLTSSFSFAGSATWKSNPTDSHWNNSANWTPATVPNGSSDTATFGSSSITSISTSSDIEVSRIVFNSGASAYTITPEITDLRLTILDGLKNNSGLLQTLGSDVAPFHFFFYVAVDDLVAATGRFQCYAVMGTGLFTIPSSEVLPSVFVCCPGSAGTGTYEVFGELIFSISSTASEANLTVHRGGNGTPGGSLVFQEHSSTAADATITLEGASTTETDTASHLSFSLFASADNATIVANGGTNGGEGATVFFEEHSTGDNAKVTLVGNSKLDSSNHRPNLIIGSVDGTGDIFLGQYSLSIGSNSLDTLLAGVIQDGGASGGTGGSLTKVGSGVLSLTGANTYTGGTVVTHGILRVGNKTGSGTGSAAVRVNGGTLAGSGTIAGTVTVGGVGDADGQSASLAPSAGATTATLLTIQDTLTFQRDGIYACKVNTNKVFADQVSANGITINSGAQFKLTAVGHKTLPVGTFFKVLDNTSATLIAGIFSNLPDGGTITVGNNTFQANYEGGDGNDLTLTVVP